jgi:hypothetical protein
MRELNARRAIPLKSIQAVAPAGDVATFGELQANGASDRARTGDIQIHNLAL